MLSIFNRVEIQINSVCDMKCFSCDRFIPTHPGPPMTVSQVEHFVTESLTLDWEWKRIHILGGEPSLHPRFEEIINTLLPCKKRWPDSVLRVISNGEGKIKQYKKRLENWGVEVAIERKVKSKDPPWFSNMLRAPYDTNPDPKPPCSIYSAGESGCGLGLTRHGFFLCGAGASIARVTGQDIGVMHIADLTDEVMQDQAKTICNLCGHWNPRGCSTRPNSIENAGTDPGPFWTDQLNNPVKHSLSLYGESK